MWKSRSSKPVRACSAPTPLVGARHARPATAVFLTMLASCAQYPSGGNVRLHLDMVDQPSYRAQTDPRGLPPGSVPAARDFPARPHGGADLFGIYCTPCHGASARGDGIVAAKMVKPADLTAQKYVEADDVLFLNALRNGSGLMPPYYEHLSLAERQAVINHIRRLQRP